MRYDFVVCALITSSYQHAAVELRHLRYFLAVAETLSFRRAAERLRVAQPALSKQIRDLEHAIGARLFDRNTAGVALTDAGTVLLDEVRDVLERVEMAATAAREAAAGRSGRLTIGNIGTLSATLLPPALSAFRARYPAVEVNLRDLGLPDQLNALRAGLVQVGFALHDDARELPRELEAVEVMRSRVTVALGVDHPLAGKSRISLSELATEQILCVGEPGRNELHRQRTLRFFASRGIRHRPVKPVSSFESLVALVEGDHGVALLVPTHRHRGGERMVFRRIREDGDDLEVRLLAVWRRVGGSQLARNFVDVLRGLYPTSAGATRG